MKPFLLSTLLFLTAYLTGQVTTSFLDIVELKKGEDQRGTLIGYRYGEMVTLVAEDGDIVEIPWKDVRRVSFRSIREAKQAPEIQDIDSSAVSALPDRKWRHTITTWVGISVTSSDTDFSNNGFGGREHFVGTGVGYHFLRQFGPLAVGLGPDFEVMNGERKERLASLTALVEYRWGKRRLQPAVRFRGGASIPIGHPDLNVETRQVSPVFHPSVGIHLAPVRGHWSALVLDLGYRFSQLDVTVVNQNLEVVDRKIQYRRFTLSLGTNF